MWASWSTDECAKRRTRRGGQRGRGVGGQGGGGEAGKLLLSPNPSSLTPPPTREEGGGGEAGVGTGMEHHLACTAYRTPAMETMSVVAATIIGIWMRHPSARLPRHIFHPYSNWVTAGIVLHYHAPLPRRPNYAVPTTPLHYQLRRSTTHVPTTPLHYHAVLSRSWLLTLLRGTHVDMLRPSLSPPPLPRLVAHRTTSLVPFAVPPHSAWVLNVAGPDHRHHRPEGPPSPTSPRCSSTPSPFSSGILTVEEKR
uniref:Uncharacterized protein n=1 Tax=Oryza sativa subsp. indica TaxID=39946 RepID=Q9XF28_ORYSI|nr:hypothetical protein [Oryza sativa Indica Group]